jgi:hypothetical protein
MQNAVVSRLALRWAAKQPSPKNRVYLAHRGAWPGGGFAAKRGASLLTPKAAFFQVLFSSKGK